MGSKRFDITGAIKHGVVISGCYYHHTGRDILANLPRFEGQSPTCCHLKGLPLSVIITAGGTILTVREDGGYKREAELSATVAQPRINELKSIEVTTAYKTGDEVWFVTDRCAKGLASTIQRGRVLPVVTFKVNMEDNSREVWYSLQVVKNGMSRTIRVLESDLMEVDAK